MQFFLKTSRSYFFFLKAASCRDDNFEMMWLVAGLYDNAGYAISKWGIQNLIIFCPNINIAQRKLLYLVNRHIAKLSKSAKIKPRKYNGILHLTWLHGSVDILRTFWLVNKRPIRMSSDDTTTPGRPRCKQTVRLSPCLSPLDFWNIECHSIFFSISKYQVKKSIWLRNWFL